MGDVQFSNRQIFHLAEPDLFGRLSQSSFRYRCMSLPQSGCLSPGNSDCNLKACTYNDRQKELSSACGGTAARDPTSVITE